jgi:copper(I)-binding protein
MPVPRFVVGLAAAFVLSTCLPAIAHDYRVGDLRIDHPWSRATPPAARVGAGYLVVTNGGAAADRLMAAISPAAARVEIHEMRMDGSVMRMREMAQGLKLPAGAKVELKPGGYHLMFMDLKAPLTAGAEVPVTLVFERAGRVDVKLKVEAATTRGPQPHGSTGSGGHRH